MGSCDQIRVKSIISLFLVGHNPWKLKFQLNRTSSKSQNWFLGIMKGKLYPAIICLIWIEEEHDIDGNCVAVVLCIPSLESYPPEIQQTNIHINRLLMDTFSYIYFTVCFKCLPSNKYLKGYNHIFE